ncbi:dmX-like protein 2 [Argopecten irradians]|uniref:dmX-like protein 2 n=1 Tax=Argopecten irradians TaxID=31199 RepID=UPI0037198968
MNRHQVLTGACNSGDQCYSVGSVEGIHFTAYAAGCDIVILASDFQRVQIIPGVTHGNVKVNCIDCSTDTGKIAASYQNKVYVFEPTPLLHHESTHMTDFDIDHKKLDYQWYQTAMFETTCFINCITWNMEGSKLLTAGDTMQIWVHHQDSSPGSHQVQFSMGGDDTNDINSHDSNHLGPDVHSSGHPMDTNHLSPEVHDESTWECIWSQKPATPIYHVKFSPDGLLFASAGKADRLVKIWHEDRKLQLPLMRADSSVSPKKEVHHYSFVYIAHPRAVTGFSWRKTSKYMPRGSVANMLVTSCADNVCRLWCETILPDDGLVDLEQFDPASSSERKFHTHRHKKRFMQRLKTIRNQDATPNSHSDSPDNDLEDSSPEEERHAIHKRRKHHKFGPDTLMSMANLSSINSAGSIHDFHKFALHNNGVAPPLHFHLAASINPETDIPLLPVVGSKSEAQHNFQLHWLNNKELQFTMEAEVILQDLHKSSISHHHHHDLDVGSDSDSFQDHSSHQVHNGDDHETEGHPKKKKSGLFKKKHKRHRSPKENKELGNFAGSQSSIASDQGDHVSEGTSSGGTSPEVPGSMIDALDRKIEALLKDWHQSADMLFSIHPVDGSYLVWLVDWMDEYNPYCFRQAQVSFSSRLPHAFPVPDARTMATNLLMYCNYSKMDIKSAMRISESPSNPAAPTKIQTQPAPATGKCFPGQNDNMLIPNVLLITKHFNGSLNQWQISFADSSKFSTVVSVAHASRACGHRFRTNSAACHPVLPLLLTTSHHNVPKPLTPCKNGDCHGNGDHNQDEGHGGLPGQESLVGGVEFCSELILWRVDPVGPLSKSGGIIELARINSPQLSAFDNVAWVPTLLPSSTLGSYSNSPSALFVASNGNSLMMYQAVIDARTLLLEMGHKKDLQKGMSFSSNTSSGYSVETPRAPGELFNIVSLQSSARPGCIIEMEAIADAKQDWQQTQLLHVFQEQLVTGRPSNNPNGMEAIVDLRESGSFSENFYLVVLERNKDKGSTIHMWKINIASQTGLHDGNHSRHYVPDNNFIQEDESDNDSFIGSPVHGPTKPTAVVCLTFSTTKVCSQALNLPDGVSVVSASVSAGHLSSASIYPACLAPYLLATACSDGKTRFWRCDLKAMCAIDHCEMTCSTMSFELAVEEEDGVRKPTVSTVTRSDVMDTSFSWEEWHMMGQSEASLLHVRGQPISVSCAYSGRVAVAYRLGGVRSAPDNDNKYVNLYVAVYECESTGGSEWTLEDTIELKNISIPDPKAEIDLNFIFTSDNPSPRSSHYDDDSPGTLSPSSSLVNMTRTKSVPSLSTIFTVRKCIAEHGNKTGMLQQKHLVQLDWVSTEDGNHILTVGVGSRILMYSQVSNDIVQSSKRSGQTSDKNMNQSFSQSIKDVGHRRSMFQKSKSMVVDDRQEEIKWMKLRSIDLSTADGLPPLPMHLSWVRGGILVVGMDNEMHVYSQWRGSGTNDVLPVEENDHRSFEDAGLSMNLPNLKPQSFKPSYSMPSFKHLNTLSLKKEKLQGSESNLLRFSLSKDKSESLTSLSAIHEFGLFEAARQANPVLPQYHPKKLMELLNFGKIRRVKAILAHLVRYVAGGDINQAEDMEEYDKDDGKWNQNRPRGISVSGASPCDMPRLQEEVKLDYKEISSIPPLPMYALLAADEDNTVAKADTITSGGQVTTTTEKDYGDLFDTGPNLDDELDITIGASSVDSRTSRTRLQSTATSSRQNPYYFGPEYSLALTSHLTHTQLPGLSSLDQMYLLALADTVANTKMDFADRMETDKPDLSMHENLNEGNAAESMDDCGLRFILAMRHHTYLLRTLQIRQRIILQQQGLKSFNLVWGYHSEATEELLSYIPGVQRDDPTWEELKQFGAGWWINNINILRRCIEKIAKAAFQRRKDPMDSAIFYLAMKKKNVLWGLYRSIEDKKMMQFFKNDFSQDRWRKAALKNAFALLGRQRFTHAAAFFLLAGALNDAVEVCLDKLNDIQLALVVCRLYDGEDMMPDSVKKILYTSILGCDEKGDNYDSCKAHPDPFLRSMAMWSLKDYRGSLNTLLHSNDSRHHKVMDSVELEGHNAMPSVFNFYNFLRTHPLLVRQRIAATGQSKRNKNIIPGFTRQQTVVLDDSSVFVDKVTPVERKLFFTTAHSHYMNGCPLLALEVLSKLPPVIEDKKTQDVDFESETSSKDDCINTGTLEDNAAVTDWSKPVVNGFKDTSSDFDWSTPMPSTKNASDSMDWGAPVTNFDVDDAPSFNISSSEDDGDDEDDDDSKNVISSTKGKLEKLPTIVVEEPSPVLQSSEGMSPDKPPDKVKDKGHQVDIFAQQYKFIACLKVLMEEMQTLATGFEVDGGQLRFQLYIWLEREVEVLQYLCNYGDNDPEGQEDIHTNTDALNGYDDDTLLDVNSGFTRSMSQRSDSSYKPTLHEVILAEKMDFEAKLERMARRKQWLRSNQQLLRTLASYCVLQGSGGGGLASVEMELLLLLQELQQDKPQQQLLSPLPFPTTLPLLSASIASSKTVVADPIQHIQCMTQDLLHSIVELTVPPSLGINMNTVLVMQNLSVALSSCIYQCLCDCDSFVVSLNETQGTTMDGFMAHNFNSSQAGHLMAGVQRYRRKSSTGDNFINTPPSKWPGVTSLRVLLAQEKDDAAPKLNILCCESLIAVYVSLLVNAMAMYDCNMLYRLVSHRFEHQMWGALFGGGVKTALKVANNPHPVSMRPGDESRIKLTMKVMGGGPAGTKEKTTFRETFVPPELSMISFFMTKPFNTASEKEFHYDSEESLSDEDEPFDDDEDDYLRPKTLPLASTQQSTDPTSYSWALIRFCVVKVILHNLQVFLPQIGIELQELPICSTLMHTVLKTLEQWMEVLKGKLELFAGPPEDFIAGLQLDVITGVPQSKYQVLLQPQNSPFTDSHVCLPIKRLWFHLLKQSSLKDVFLRYIYRKKKIPQMEESVSQSDGPDGSVKIKDPMKIIHKEQDIITAFALNQDNVKVDYLEANSSFLVLSTQKDVIELDIGHLLNPPSWMEDDNEMDIEYIRNPNPTEGSTTDFFVVQAPSDNQQSGLTSGMSSPQTGASTPTHPGSGVYSQTGRGTNVMKRHLKLEGKGIHIPGITNPQFSQHVLDRSRRLLRLLLRRPVSGVRRIGSHPNLPHYLTGGSDGSVRLYEWGHIQPLAMLRQPGVFPKVTKVLFSSQGNKCCVSDTEGDICLWQVGLGSNFNKPIMKLKCHNKTTSDFAFVGSSSLIATAGHSSESRNVCLWDTLLPQRSACVHAFTCHEHGCPAVVYAPHHQLLISGGRKGEICIFDIRQRQIRHTFQAHDSAIRCLAMDPEEEYFVTGSSEGDIKVWGLDVHQMVVNFPGEHSKNTSELKLLFNGTRGRCRSAMS